MTDGYIGIGVFKNKLGIHFQIDGTNLKTSICDFRKYIPMKVENLVVGKIGSWR